MKKETLDAMRAWLDGEMLEYRPVDSNLKWHKVKSASECQGLPFLFDDTDEYRIKPRTIRIGEYELTAGEVSPLEFREDYYMPDLIREGMVQRFRWSCSEFDKQVLERGLVHRSMANAKIHAAALISISHHDKSKVHEFTPCHAKEPEIKI